MVEHQLVLVDSIINHVVTNLKSRELRLARPHCFWREFEQWQEEEPLEK